MASASQPLLLKEEDGNQAPALLPFSSSESELQSSSVRNNDEFRTWLVEELGEQFQIAGPMIMVNLLQYSLRVVSLMFVGRLGELALSSSQIASTTAAATGLNVMMGLASALETLCGQAYGAKEYRLTGIFLQRAVFVLILIAIPISFVWWNMAPILTFMGQDPAISQGAQEYSRFLIPSLFAQAFLQPLVRFLQTQSAVTAMMVFTATTLMIHIPLCYLIVFHFGVGFRGAAIANGVSHWINVLFLASYVIFSSTCKKTWTGFSRSAFQDIFLFLKIAVPSTVMMWMGMTVERLLFPSFTDSEPSIGLRLYLHGRIATILESWCFDFVILMSGLLPNPELEASSLSICLTTDGLIFMVPLGLSAAVSTRVSNKLGAGLPYAANAAVKVAVSLTLIEGSILCGLLIWVRHGFPYLFTNDPDVVSYVSSMTPLLAAVAFLDSCQATLSGVIRGCGWQHLGAYTNLCAFYGIGIPVSLLMTFHFHYHGYGLWIGMLCGLSTQSLLLSIITFTLNWRKLAGEASHLIHEAKHDYEHAYLTTTVHEKEEPFAVDH